MSPSAYETRIFLSVGLKADIRYIMINEKEALNLNGIYRNRTKTICVNNSYFTFLCFDRVHSQKISNWFL
jgi:hypothetical protein